jgi:hypothetical protein
MNYRTECNGITNQLNAKNIEDAKIEADESVSYCQSSIDLVETNDEGNESTITRKWWGVAFDSSVDESENPIQFGSFGYYADWE